jgi:hypothetical protein
LTTACVHNSRKGISETTMPLIASLSLAYPSHPALPSAFSCLRDASLPSTAVRKDWNMLRIIL